jgi:hypothetical protein
MFGLTADNVRVVYGVGAVTCTRISRKRIMRSPYRHATIASWWMERNLITPTLEDAGMPRKRCEGESRRERPRLQREGRSLPATPPQSCPRQGYAATAADSAALICTDLRRHSGRYECTSTFRHNQQQALSQLVQAPIAIILSVNDMFKVVATIF